MRFTTSHLRNSSRKFRGTSQMVKETLSTANLSVRLLYSSFLILIGIGYIAAVTYLYMTHAQLDGKSGIDMQDIVTSYYGNRSGTRLEAAIQGPMKIHLQPAQSATIIHWLNTGASQQGYQSEIRPILQQNCMECHNATTSSLLKIPNLSSFQGVQQVTKVDKGMSIQSLVQLSHIHLFGIGLMLFAVGVIFIKAELSPWLMNTLIVLPFVSILADIISWFLTKWYPLYAYVVVLGGTFMGIAMGAQILISLYQMWLLSPEPSPLVMAHSNVIAK